MSNPIDQNPSPPLYEPEWAKSLRLVKPRFIGYDDWARSLWKMPNGSILVDVDGELHTRTPEWDEPCFPTGIYTPSILK